VPGRAAALVAILESAGGAGVSARQAWAAVEAGEAQGFLAVHAITTIHYLLRKEAGAAKTARLVSQILRAFAVAPADGAVLQEALQLACPDFENAVTAASARRALCRFYRHERS